LPPPLDQAPTNGFTRLFRLFLTTLLSAKRQTLNSESNLSPSLPLVTFLVSPRFEKTA
jgi:hypothetical protein